MSLLQRINVRAARAGAAALVLACALVALAVPAPARAADDDLPARVGRIADLGGAVYLAPEDRASEWAEVDRNYPVAGGDNLWVASDGRAEVDFGGGQLRLAGDTNVHLSRLDDRELSLFVAQGRVIVRLRALDPGEVARIDTPNTQVTLLRPGLYRVDVSGDRLETTLVVREGEATAAVTNGLQQVLPGQTATLFGDQDVQADVRNGTGLDGFDTWSADRDRYYRASRTASYVSPQMVGAADLDRYGGWETYADYGAVWFPTAVAAGWAPYRYGRWITLGGWGLTWVDDAPWGYAPFHYGRWVYVSGRWGWCPGRYVARPVWAPALVAWYGGSGYVVGGYGPVYGWVPLGWRDPYIPSWRNCSHRCWSNYNRPYAVNVAERPRQPPTYYANHQVPGAITAMSGAAFTTGKPVAPNRVSLTPAQLAGAAPLAAAPQVNPITIGTNRVRPGSAGVPAPASATLATTKPMITRQRSIGAAPGAPAQPSITPAPAAGAAQAPRAVAVPSHSSPPPQTLAPSQPRAQRAAPVQNAAEPPAVGSAPRGNAQTRIDAPRPGLSAPSAPPATMRAAPPPQASASAPPADARAAPPRPVTAPPQPAMRAAPPPQPQAQPQLPPQAQPASPPQVQVAPPPQAQQRPGPPAQRGGDKPAPGKPAPAPAQNAN